MSTANKLTYLNDTKQELKQKINNLGGDITDQTTFRQYVDKLQTIYDNAPKTSYAEGSNITLSNTLKGKLDFEDGIVGYGDTYQYSTTGKNLYEPSLTADNITILQQRCNVSINDDEITISATGSDFYWGNITSEGQSYNGGKGIKILTNNNSKISFWLSNTNIASNFITPYDSNGIAGRYTQINSNQGTYTVPSGTSFITFRFGKSDSTSGEVYKTKIMVCYGDTIPTLSTYEKYTGNSPSPSPSYPQDIEVVRGKNRLKLENGTTTMHNVTSVTENGKITLNGTPNSTDYINLIGTYVANTTDTFTLTPFKSATNSDIRLLYTINDGSLVNSDNTPQISLTRGNILKVYLRISSTSQITNFTLQPQLEKGSQATSYLPYNTIEVVERGKNLLNIANFQEHYTLNEDGVPIYAGSQTRLANTTPIDVEGLEKVTLTFSSWTGGNQFIYSLLRADNTKISRVASNTSGTTITIGQAKYLYICFYDSATLSNVTDAMLVEGDTGATYEPYQTPQTYQLSLGNKELYEDSTIVRNSDGSWKYVDKYSKKTMTGNDIIRLTPEVSVGSNYRHVIQFTGATNASKAWCNWAKFLKDYGKDEVHFYLAPSPEQILLFVPLTNEELKARADVVPLEVVYPVETETPITDTTLINQLNAWYYSHSFTGTTIIEIDGQLPLIIKVRALKGE